MKKRIYIFVIVVFTIIAFWDEPVDKSEMQKDGNSCAVCYLLNVDGMKGLGHAAFMLLDEHGSGTVYSYNGMQYSLLECLAGKAGVGKMKVFFLSSDEVTVFFDTGRLQVEDTAECDNFDRMLYRYISRDDYEKIQEGTKRYIEIGTEFESIYAAVIKASGEEKILAEERMKEFLSQEGLLKYQIYKHNCDTVTRELIALVDKDMREYNAEHERLTPTGNYIGMCRALSEEWGVQKLGEDTLWEKVLWR